MRSVGMLLAGVFVMAAPVQAEVLLTDNFDGENEGTGAFVLNYNKFANWDVNGNVDLVFGGDVFNLDCNGGCVDLDGTTGPGQITSKNAFAYGAHEILRVSFDLSGSQRDTIADDFYVGFVGGESNFVAYGYTDSAGVDHFTAGPLFSDTIAGTAPWDLKSVFAITGTAGFSKITFGTNSADKIGPLLDNVVVTTAAVPEPTTWAMMIAGFGLVGSALRRRKTAVAFA